MAKGGLGHFPKSPAQPLTISTNQKQKQKIYSWVREGGGQDTTQDQS